MRCECRGLIGTGHRSPGKRLRGTYPVHPVREHRAAQRLDPAAAHADAHLHERPRPRVHGALHRRLRRHHVLLHDEHRVPDADRRVLHRRHHAARQNPPLLPPLQPRSRPRRDPPHALRHRRRPLEVGPHRIRVRHGRLWCAARPRKPRPQGHDDGVRLHLAGRLRVRLSPLLSHPLPTAQHHIHIHTPTNTTAAPTAGPK